MTLTGHIVGTKGNTGRGIASIVENADYTITINLTDGSSYTTAPIAGFTAVEFDENYDLVVTKTDGTTETVETDIADYNALLKGYKDDAETAATNANTYQGWARDYANNAQAQAGYASTYKQAAYDSKVAAGTSETNAGTQALKSEGYAVGKQNGTDVSSGSDYYHNNAKYYSDLASTSETNAGTSESNASASASSASADALKAEGYAVGKQNGTTVISGTYYHNNAMYYNSQATNMASLATNKANSAGTDALKAEGFSVGEQNGTPVTSDSPYYENNAKYYSEEAAASAASLVIEDTLDEDSTNALENGVITKEFAKKANIDGAYESMTVGNAEQLVSTVFVNDEEPYNFRTAGGSADIGDREYDTIVGGTVAWNQLVQNGDFEDTSGWTAAYGDISVADNVLTYTATRLGTDTYFSYVKQPAKPNIPAHHKVLACFDIYPAHSKNVYAYLLNYAGNPTARFDAVGGKWNTYAKIIENGTASTKEFQIALNIQESTGYSVGEQDKIKNFCIFDLTAMFGSTIADYIYSLETANAGAGVAWFRKLFPKPYYAYNAGELMSVNTSAHNTVGFNQLDPANTKVGGAYNPPIGATVNLDSSGATYSGTNPIVIDVTTVWYGCCLISEPLVAGQQYEVAFKTSGPNTADKRISQYLIDKDNTVITSPYNLVGNSGDNVARKFTPPESGLRCAVTIVSTSVQKINVTDACVHLVWDGERDGEYEEYVKHSYPLDSDLTLRGIPKLDASNNLYYDGDTYEADGTVTRKYGIVDLGSLTWDYNGTRFKSSQIPTLPSLERMRGVCSKYPLFNGSVADASDKSLIMGVGADDPSVYVKDSAYSDATAFKTAMNGVYLVYELATPTTETADPFQSPQIVDDFGTEEYVDYAVSQGDRDVAIPVGHETQYMANLKAKLEMSPNSPEGAGDYIVRQTNGENEYVTLASNATIQNIIARLEALEGGGE